MRIRWPFVRRKVHDREVAKLLMQVADGVADLSYANAERVRLTAELARLRELHNATVVAKDEAYRIVARQYYDADNARIDAGAEIIRLRDRLDSYGLGEPTWAASASPYPSAVIVADFNGVHARID